MVILHQETKQKNRKTTFFWKRNQKKQTVKHLVKKARNVLIFLREKSRHCELLKFSFVFLKLFPRKCVAKRKFYCYFDKIFITFPTDKEFFSEKLAGNSNTYLAKKL